MVTELAVLGGCFLAWVATARVLYGRWRPGRVPIQCAGDCRARAGGSHALVCYRRVRKDLGRVTIDSDGEAIGWAMIAAMAFPVLLVAAAVGVRPRELDAERQAREKREREKSAAQAAHLQAHQISAGTGEDP